MEKEKYWDQLPYFGYDTYRIYSEAYLEIARGFVGNTEHQELVV